MTLPSSGPPLDLNRLLEVLTRNEVDFVVVGGSAAGFLGVSRLTEDADCVVRRERANLERLATALRELHARLRVARMSDEEAKTLPVKVDGMMLETTGNSTWTTDAGPFDVLADLKDFEGRSVPYEDLLTRSMIVRGDGFEVHVASVDDIIAAKTFANRDKDREALPELLDIQAREHSQRYEQYESDVALEVHEDSNGDIEP
ncbi:MAG TPA: nucleotidyl transferase AbiEii/AbiGii toxin family protein [Acidimicrobiales bacterium]